MDSNTIFDVSLWSHQMFGSCRLGDARRTQRAVAVGASMAMAPERSLLQQSEGAWASAKATYRLLNTDEVDPAEVWRPQQQQTLDDASSQRGVVLFIQDTTELDYSAFESTEGLGYIGNSSRVGFLAQHTLAVLPAVGLPAAGPQEARILGLAMQRLWRREESSHRRESRSRRAARWRESDVWYETLEAIGPVPAEQQWISVGDRASDVYSYMRRSEELGWGFLLRVTQNRCMTTVDGQEAYLKTYMRSLSAGFTRELHDGTTLQVAYARVSVQPPTLYTAKGSPAIEAWAIRCWGQTAQGKELEWILLSNQPLEDHQAVSEAISWYEHRWLIEEYHKCLKTGCRVEHRGLKQADALERMIAMMAVVAVRLLSLRNMARTAGEQPAITQVNPALVQLLIVRLSLQTDPNAMTLYEFYRALARLGGFLGRKSDGEPGWQTLWLGWHRLNDMWHGAQILNQSG